MARRRGSQCRWGGSVAQCVWSAGRGGRKDPRCRAVYVGEDVCFYSAPLKQPLTGFRLLTRKRSGINPALVALAPVQTRPGLQRRPGRGRAMAGRSGHRGAMCVNEVHGGYLARVPPAAQVSFLLLRARAWRTRAVSCALVGGVRDIKSEINQGGLGRYLSTGGVDSGFIALLFEA
jgi:hypothetical protein